MRIRRVIRYLFKDKRQRALSKQPIYVQLEFSFMEFLSSSLIQRLMKYLLDAGRVSVKQYTLYTLLVQTIENTNTMIETDAYTRAVNYDMKHNLEHFYSVYKLLTIHVKKEHLLKLQWEYCNARETI